MPEVRPFHALHPDFGATPDLTGAPRRGWVRDGQPGLYLVRQTFEAGGRKLSRRGILAALQLGVTGSGALLPHEPPDPAKVRLRFEQLSTSRTWSDPLLVLHAGDLGDLESRLALERERRPDAWGTDAGGAALDLWRLSDPQAVGAVVAALAGRRGYLADGQNRHEAGLAWARRCEVGGAKAGGPHAHALALLVSLTDPGVVIEPVHRVLRGVPVPEASRLSVLLDEHFEVEVLPEDPARPAGLAWTLRRLEDAGRAGHAIGIVTRSDGRARLLRLREGVDVAHVSAMPRSPTLRAVDAALVHALVLQHTLGVTPERQVPGVVDPEADASAVVRAVVGGEAGLGVLLNPAPPWQVRSVADAGELLPPQTTRFFPRVPAGAVASTVDPAERL